MIERKGFTLNLLYTLNNNPTTHCSNMQLATPDLKLKKFNPFNALLHCSTSNS